MTENTDMEMEVKKLREEVSELRKMVNLLLGLIMEDDEIEVEDKGPAFSRMYN